MVIFRDFPMKNCDFPMKNGDFPMKNCDFPMKNGDFPMKNGDFPMKNGDFPMKNGDFPMKNGDFPIKHGDFSRLMLPQAGDWTALMANFGEMATVGAAVKEDCDFGKVPAVGTARLGGGVAVGCVYSIYSRILYDI